MCFCCGCLPVFVCLSAALALCKYSLAGSHVTEASANQTVSVGNGDNGTGRYGQVGKGGSTGP